MIDEIKFIERGRCGIGEGKVRVMRVGAMVTGWRARKITIECSWDGFQSQLFQRWLAEVVMPMVGELPGRVDIRIEV